MEDRDLSGNGNLASKLVDVLFDENRDLLILTTDKLEIVKINQSASIFLGASIESLQGRSICSLLDSGNQARIKTITPLLKIDGEIFNTYLDIADCLNIKHQLSIGIRYIHCSTRKSNYFLIVMRRTDKNNNGTLKHIDPTQLLKRLFKGLSDSVILIDMNSRTICDCNIAAEIMFDYPRGSLLGRSPQFLAPNEDTANEYEALNRESCAKTGIFQDKIPCKRRDGSLFMTLATNIALFDNKGEQKYIIAINRDLTQEEEKIDDIIRYSEQSNLLLQKLNESIIRLKDKSSNSSLSKLGFTNRQIEITAILATGAPTKVIAMKLNVTESAIKNHLTIMYRRVGVNSRVGFLRYIHEHQIRIE